MTTTPKLARDLVLDRWCKSLVQCYSDPAAELDASMLDIEFLSSIATMLTSFRGNVVRGLRTFIHQTLTQPSVTADICSERFNTVNTVLQSADPLQQQQDQVQLDDAAIADSLKKYFEACGKFYNFLLPSAVGRVIEKADSDGGEKTVEPGEMFILQMYLYQ